VGLAVLAVDAYARMQALLLPPGRLWRLVPESLIYKLLLGAADELARVDERARDLLRESDPATAVELLPEYEEQFAIAAAATEAERQARAVAATVRQQGVRPADIRRALAPLLALDPEDVVIIERTPSHATVLLDQREIYRFFVYRDPSLPGTYYIDAAQELLDSIAPSHTRGYVIESIAAKTDHAFSLTDRDIIGS
jgi:hypothetical protein